MTATPAIKSAAQNIAVSTVNKTSANVLSGATNIDGSAVDFSTGWTFLLNLYSQNSLPPNSNANVASGFTATGGAAGKITLGDTGGIYGAALWTPTGYSLYGSTDSGATYTKLYSGNIAFSQ